MNRVQRQGAWLGTLAMCAVSGCASTDADSDMQAVRAEVEVPGAMDAPSGGEAAAQVGMPGPQGGSPGNPPPPPNQGAATPGTAGDLPSQPPADPPGGSTDDPGQAGAGGGQDAPPPTPPMGDTCLQPGNGSYEERGPYEIGTMDVSIGSSGMYTLFYPQPLEDNCLHPIVVWGNGTAVEGSGVYAFFNDNAASWGMVVAASHNANVGSGTFHNEAADYLLAQNEDSSSIFFQKLSTRVGTSGHSQGGFGAMRGSAHPNVQAAVTVGATGTSTDKVSVLVLTGTNDIGAGAFAGLDRAGGPMFVASWEGGDHFVTETLAGYVARDPGTLQMQRLYAAWFRCFLGDDQVACGMFYGGTPGGCGICSDPGWNMLGSSNM